MHTKEDITKLQKTVNSLICGQQQTSELINSLNRTIELQNQSSTKLIETIASHMQEQRKFIKKIITIGATVIITAILGIPLLLTITSMFG
jgi:hypothetical protein